MAGGGDQAGSPTGRLGQVPALDGLRGLAVLMVVVSHLDVNTVWGPTGWEPLDAWMSGGHLGVDLFFVLSGFLITSLLLEEFAGRGRISLGAFWARRGLRLLPALLLLLAAHVVWAQFVDVSPEAELRTVRSALLYVHNWHVAFDVFRNAPGLGHLWSLSIEEQFYLVWPLVVLWLVRRRRSSGVTSVVLVAAIVGVAIHRLVMWRQGSEPLPLTVRTDTRIDSLLVGCLAAVLWGRGWIPRHAIVTAAWVGALGIVVSTMVMPPLSPRLIVGGYTLFAVCGAAVVVGVVDGRWRLTPLFCLRPLRAVGKVSYGVYLWHHAVFTAVAYSRLPWSRPVAILVGLSATALLTAASWFLVERPALRLKRHFERRPAAEVRAADG